MAETKVLARDGQETAQAAPVGGWGRISGRVPGGDGFEAGCGGFALLGCGGGRSNLVPRALGCEARDPLLSILT